MLSVLAWNKKKNKKKFKFEIEGQTCFGLSPSWTQNLSWLSRNTLNTLRAIIWGLLCLFKLGYCTYNYITKHWRGWNTFTWLCPLMGKNGMYIQGVLSLRCPWPLLHRHNPVYNLINKDLFTHSDKKDHSFYIFHFLGTIMTHERDFVRPNCKRQKNSTAHFPCGLQCC